MTARLAATKLVAEIEHVVRRILRGEMPRLERRTVVAVQSASVKGRGGTCSVVDSVGNTTFGIRWYRHRPRPGDLVLVEVPPPGGTRRVVAIDRELAAAGAGANALSPDSVQQATQVLTEAGAPRADGPTAYFLVATYGAVGDGAADDTVALQDVPIDAAAVAGGGTVLCLPGAVHLTTAKLLLQASGLTLDLNGATIRRASTSDATTDPVVLVGTPANADAATANVVRVVVRNGVIQGNAKATHGVRVTSADFARVELLDVSGCTTQQVAYDCAPTVTASRGNANASGSGLRLTATGSAGGLLLDGSSDGAVTSTTTRGYFENVYASVVDGDAVLFGGARGNVIDGLRCEINSGAPPHGRLLVFASHATSAAGAATGNHVYQASLSNSVVPANSYVQAYGTGQPSTANYVVLDAGSLTPFVEAGASLSYVLPSADGSMHLGTSVVSDGALYLPEMTAPATPASGLYALYAKANGHLYGKNDSGTEVQLDAGGSGSAVDVQVFATAGTFSGASGWQKPSGATAVYVLVVAAGGGGGAGRRGAVGTNRTGGAGGGGGGTTEQFYPAAALSTPQTVVVGAGGAGGAQNLVNDSNGAAGTAGTSSTFAQTTAGGGGGGTGGINAGSVSGGAGGAGQWNGGNGGAGSSVAGSDGVSVIGAPGGGGGGGIDTTNTSSNGGNGGTSKTTVAGGAGSTPGGGVTAGPGVAPFAYWAGSGGGGGSNGASARGGGAGIRGSGGGGTSSTANTNGGVGGAGGDGYVVVISY